LVYLRFQPPNQTGIFFSSAWIFIKGNKIEELKEALSEIINYWQKSKQPEVE
jgi:hypothetical protein